MCSPAGVKGLSSGRDNLSPRIKDARRICERKSSTDGQSYMLSNIAIKRIQLL